ncbi:probable cytochrome P450 313a4 [Eupeodes corollae]|uniref:probable cytochrome P450 313a4 n=1 Tax=Eupeodes corollae TaxID=290404 RepID=UPI002491C68D|nr:probable cytochrome P450 313a4 [Eupeodes corollae]
MMILDSLLGILAVLLFYFLWSRRRFYYLFYKMPGPPGYPIIGMAHKLTKREEILSVFLKMERIYGRKFVSWLGPFPFLVIAEPELAETILTSPDCINKAFIYDALDDGTGRGLFSLKSPQWNHHRKLLNPAFSHKVLLSFLPIFNREADNLNFDLNEVVGAGEVDISSIIQKCTLNVAAQTTMGRQMASVKDHNKDLLPCFQSILETMTSMLFSPWLRNKFFLQMASHYPLYLKSKNTLRSFIQNLISEKLSQKEADMNRNSLSDPELEIDIKKNPNIFIDRAIDLVKTGDFTWKEVEDESNVIVFGAFETTSNTVGYTLMLLAMFPKYQEKVYDEAQSIFQSKGSDTDLTYEDTQQMTYMDMVLNETMRVMAPVPVIARETMRDVTLSNGIVLPKGLQIAIDIFNMHRDPEYWGTDSTIFNPDNFLPANMVGKHPYSFIPFTKGLRNCIGWRYALISSKIILSKLIRKYRFTTKFDFRDLQFVEDITIKLRKYPLLELHLREP